MSEWLKFVLAARKKDPDDGGSLYQVIFFVAVAIIYALGGIFKKRARDKEAAKPLGRRPLDEQVKTKPRYKSLGEAVASRQSLRGPTQKTLPYAKRTARQRIPPSQIRQQRPAPPTAKEVIRQVLEPVLEPEQPAQRPQRRPHLARRRPAARRPQVQQPTAPKARKDLAYAKAAKSAKKKEPATPVELVSQPSAFASLEHLSQPDNLKMAIVYAEILGQPVGLRDM